MLLPRRFLPSLSLLTAFEAAARTGSITQAARELSLTQSAVSRQIKALEEQLEVDLFIRERQTIRLTLAGATYAREIRAALQMISLSSLNLRANPLGGSLNLAILPTFGTRWLAPRLPDFIAANPGITINMVTRITQFDFRLETLDAAIHFGSAHWPGAETVLLRREQVIPACCPALKDKYAFTDPADLRRAPLLNLSSRPDAWEWWFAAHAVPPEPVHGMLIDHFATAAQAAMSGLGVALLPTFLVEDELRQGALVPALDLVTESPERYYLAWPTERGDHPPLAAFRDWILRQNAPFR
jgi:LysR family glycine cleavage system transcriptional activator